MKNYPLTSEILLQIMLHYTVTEAVGGDVDFIEVEKAEEFGKYQEAGRQDLGAFLFHAWNLDAFLNAHPGELPCVNRNHLAVNFHGIDMFPVGWLTVPASSMEVEPPGTAKKGGSMSTAAG